MKAKLIFTLALSTLFGAKAQWVDEIDVIDNPEDPAGSVSASKSVKMEDIEIKYPNTGTHYDDIPESHYEPKYSENDGGKQWEEGSYAKYPYQREADVKYKKRIWRRIDTRQKMNKSFTWAKSSAVKILYDLAVMGKVKAYYNDSLERVMSPEQAYTSGGRVTCIEILNWRNPNAADDGDMKDTCFYAPVSIDKVMKLELMEDWIWDEKYGEMRPKIIGISLLTAETYPNGVTYDVPLFWLKMEDLRPTLAMSEVYNRYNDAGRISWDDLFNQYRLFDSYVVKQTDYDDSYIGYKSEFVTDGVGALIEGKRIERELFIMEHDVWEF